MVTYIKGGDVTTVNTKWVVFMGVARFFAAGRIVTSNGDYLFLVIVVLNHPAPSPAK